ncbi:MAG: acetyltransferase, partial [Bryobacteraceae bacterium]
MAGPTGVLFALLGCLPASGQFLLPPSARGVVRVHNTDLAVLESREDRQDLPCQVTPSKPLVGFDMRFHSGYEVTLPLREIAGSENMLTVLFRVSPVNRAEDSTYFVQRIRVPSLEPDAKGDASLHGSFDVGEGKYQVDWLMRDRAERVCAHNWEFEAVLPGRDRNMNLVIMPGAIQAGEPEQFQPEPPVERSSTEAPLTVKVLMNYAPQKRFAPAMQPIDSVALISILRSISREPRFGKFSLVAFNLDERRVVYRQNTADKIDFPTLGQALTSLSFGTVRLEHLANKKGEAEFLADLLKSEVPDSDQPDALIFAGPKVLLDNNVPPDELKELGEIDYPVFYMNYNL